MPTVNPYLNFLGNCEEAFNHYKTVFGTEFRYISRYSEMPPQDGITITDDMKDLIMHVSMEIGHTVLMGSDTGGEWASNTVMGNNMSVSITADTKEQADNFFNGLSDGGKITMPLAPTFWGDYFGMCTDRFGINWMISFNEAGK